LLSKIKYHIPLGFLLIAIFIESSFPSDFYPKIDFELSDKIVHLLIYFLLYCCFYYSFINQDKFDNIKKFALLYSLLFTAFYGASDEIHQYFVPNRSCDFYDWLADFSGAMVALIFISILIKFYEPFKRLNLRKNDSPE